jgi:GNAT superfamily N-acetyltransferase
MDEITVRDARHDEANVIVPMIRSMVADMASYGGHAPSCDDTAWTNLTAGIADELKGNSAKYVIAELAGGDPVGVAGAQLITLGGVFAPKKTLHVSVVYVRPEFRRGGIGGSLLAKLLDWGRAVGSEECDLVVLSNNPAKSMYAKKGFAQFEVKMVRSL